MKCKTCGTEHRGIPKHGGYCLDHQEQRAAQAEQALDLANAHAKRLMDERDAAWKALREIKRVLAVGRNVGEDKDQAYQDAEETADFAIEPSGLQQFERTAPVDWHEAQHDLERVPNPESTTSIDRSGEWEKEYYLRGMHR